MAGSARHLKDVPLNVPYPHAHPPSRTNPHTGSESRAHEKSIERKSAKPMEAEQRLPCFGALVEERLSVHYGLPTEKRKPKAGRAYKSGPSPSASPPLEAFFFCLASLVGFGNTPARLAHASHLAVSAATFAGSCAARLWSSVLSLERL